MRLCSFALAAALVCTLTKASAAADAVLPAAGSEDEQQLRAAGFPVDGPGLLQFFRDRTLTPAKQDRIANLIRELGDDEFPIREQASRALVQIGPGARALLRQAAANADVEIRRRAQACLETLDRANDPVLTAAAVRWLKVRAPDGAAAALVAYLPFGDDEFTQEEALTTLLTLGVRQGQVEPALLTALADTAPARRAAAALVVGRAGTAEQRQRVRKLLNDPEARVRWRAAQGLVAWQEPAALETLLALLANGPLPEARAAEDLLGRLAESKRPAVDLGEDAASRRAAAAAWKTWWESNRAQFDWSKAADAALPANPAQLARETVQALARALMQGNASAATKVLALPFVLEGEVVHNQEALRSLMDIAAKEFKDAKHSLTVMQVIGSAEYLRTAEADFKNNLNSQLRGPWLVVIVQHKYQDNATTPLALIVQVNGSRAQIRAVGPGKTAGNTPGK